MFARSGSVIAIAAMFAFGAAPFSEAEAFNGGAFSGLQAANPAMEQKSTRSNPQLLLVADDSEEAKSELAKKYLSLLYDGQINDIVDLMSRDTLVYVTKNRGLFDAAVEAMRTEAEQRGGVETLQVDDVSSLWVDLTIKFADGTEKTTTVFFDEENDSYRLDLVPASAGDGGGEVPK